MQIRMKVIKGKPHGHCFLFANGEVMFGRGPECNIRPNSDLISRQHCLLKISDHHALIRDLGSRNGTLINGQLVIGEHILKHGDTLELGPLVLQVLMESPLTGDLLVDTALAQHEDTLKSGDTPLSPEEATLPTGLNRTAEFAPTS
jgi:pSer/pThr/pTyr-binding forkhead associated (FHA) protein